MGMPHPGKDDTLRPDQILRIRRDDRSHAQVIQRSFNRGLIPGVVVNDVNH